MIGKILIVDDVSTNRIVLKVKLSNAGYQTVLAGDGAACLRLAQEESPDLILLDLMLPDCSGTEVLKRLRADPQTRRIPVVMFSAGSDVEARMAALRAGADEFLTKPIDDLTLLARLRSFMRAREVIEGIEPSGRGFDLLGLAEAPAVFEVPGQIALVTTRAETALRLRKELAAQMADRLVILGLDEVISQQIPVGGLPDVYLIEADLGGTDGGLRLMSELRSRSNSRHAAFCILNSGAGASSAAMAYDLGANDRVDASVSPKELALRLTTLLRRKRDGDRLRASVQDGLRLAMIDPLTGLHNRRYGIAQLGAIAERALAGGTAFAVMVVDLDRFKSVNDKWGHAAGDAVLVEVAERLAGNLRTFDLIARIGGEEFLVALPDTSLAEARLVAERLCQAIEEVPVALPGGVRLSVTVSIGLAISTDLQPPLRLDWVSDIVERADRALMTSKSAGRNQVTISRSAA